jgi:hypothetical protein
LLALRFPADVLVDFAPDVFFLEVSRAAISIGSCDGVWAPD